MPNDRYGAADDHGEGQEVPLPRDRLEYVADLLAELQDIVSPARCQTLIGLLALSEAEARRLAFEIRV